MAQPAQPYYTPEQYLALEEASVDKHEYYEGELYLMAGGTRRHNLICVNAILGLKQAFRAKGCQTYSSDMRVEIKAPNFYTYPDATLVCTPLDSDSDTDTTLTNPLLIVEVLSPSTATSDRTTKFELYKGLPSFKHYLLIEQDRVGVTYHFKTEAGTWKSRSYTSLQDIIKLFDFDDIELPIAEFYDRVNLAAETELQ